MNICFNYLLKTTNSLELYFIIESICCSFPEVIIDTYFQNIVEISILLSKQFFNKDDKLCVSEAQIFESTFLSLCKYSKKYFSYIWDICSMKIKDLSDMFILVRLITLTFSIFLDFYLQKIDILLSFLKDCFLELLKIIILIMIFQLH